MTAEEFDAIVKATCPHCAGGSVPCQRADTKEWVHNFVQPNALFPTTQQGHTICMASHFRNSDLAKGLT